MPGWLISLLIVLVSLIVLMAFGFHIFLCFLAIDMVGVYIYWGGTAGLNQLIFSMRAAIGYSLLPVPLFTVMGEIMFHSGMAPKMIDSLDKWLGRLPGRLGLLAVVSGAIFATMSGSSMASIAMLGSTLVPEMEKRGYKKPMTLGPVMGSGPLAIMIPPSALAVVLGALGDISIGALLMAIIFPGILLATCIFGYILIRSRMRPDLAPAYDVTEVSAWEKVKSTLIYVLPLSIIIFLVIGIIFLGVATPTEAAATGALGCIILSVIYKKLSWKSLHKSLTSTVNITAMVFMLIVGAQAFSQILAFTGGGKGISDIITHLSISTIWIVVGMQLIGITLGCFMSQVPIMMITLPIFMPILAILHVNPVWFGTIFLLNMEIATLTPPFGMGLFVMKSVAPKDTTMRDIYGAVAPFITINLLVMIILLAAPIISLWLPGHMINALS